MIKYKVLYGQSIWDLGLQHYGHVTGAELVVQDNPQYAMTDVPVVGSEYLIREAVPRLSDTNEAVAREYAEKGITVASGLETNLTPPGNYVEEGYWVTGYARNNG